MVVHNRHGTKQIFQDRSSRCLLCTTYGAWRGFAADSTPLFVGERRPFRPFAHMISRPPLYLQQVHTGDRRAAGPLARMGTFFLSPSVCVRPQLCWRKPELYLFRVSAFSPAALTRASLNGRASAFGHFRPHRPSTRGGATVQTYLT